MDTIRFKPFLSDIISRLLAHFTEYNSKSFFKKYFLYRQHLKLLLALQWHWKTEYIMRWFSGGTSTLAYQKEFFISFDQSLSYHYRSLIFQPVVYHYINVFYHINLPFETISLLAKTATKLVVQFTIS